MRDFHCMSRRLLASTAMGLALGLSSQAAAQEQQEAPANVDSQQDAGAVQPLIIVEGTRAAIGNSLDAKRDSETIVDVLSADDADRFPDNNIAEGLARIPGISFQRDNDSSDGEFISIRGLDATFNTVLNDGIRVGTADRFRRTPLNVVTGTGISSIFVTKVPLPEHASEGIGGVVDIRTRGALERSERLQLSGDIRDNSFAEDTGFRVAGDFTYHLTDNLGVNLNASFRRRFFNNIQINPSTTVPEILFPQEVGGIVFDDADDIEDIFDLVPTGFLDISNFTTEQVDYEAADIRDDTLNLAGTIDWEVSDATTLTFGGRYSRGNRDEIVSNIEFDVDNDDFRDGSEVPGGTAGQLIRSFRDPEVTFEAQIEDELETQQSYFLRGVTQLDTWTFNYIAGYSRARVNDPILSIDFTQELEDVPGSPGTSSSAERAVSFAPFILGGRFISPNPFNQDIFAQALNPLCGQDVDDPCGEIVDFDEELEDSATNERFSFRFDAAKTFDSDLLENIKFGFQYENSSTTELEIDIATTDDFISESGEFLGQSAVGSDNNAVPGDLGIFTGEIRSFDDIGNPFADIGFLGIPTFDRAALLNLRANARNGFATLGEAPALQELIDADEEFFSAYVQAKLNFGERFSVVGGVRVEQYEGDFFSSVPFVAELDFELNGDGDSIDLAPNTANLEADTNTDNFEFLPRLVATYYLNDDARVRASYSTSIARPTFDLLTGTFDSELTIELNDEVDPLLATIADVSEVTADFEIGNPDLRNSYSHNFDLSFEYFWNRQNAVSVAFFYKRIDDFIFNSFVFDTTPNQVDNAVQSTIDQIVSGATFSSEGQSIIDNLGGLEAVLGAAQVNVLQPQNGDTAEVYGVEVGFWHSFDYLPGILSNLGFIGNVTFQDSSTDINLGTFNSQDVLVQIGEAQAGDALIETFSFFNSPDYVGNVTLYYDDRNIEANLSYRFSGNQLEEVEAFGISQFQQGRGFLDFDFEYTFRDIGPLDRLALTFEASDLLDSGRRFSVFETRGETEAFSDLATFNGRTFRVGARVRF